VEGNIQLLGVAVTEKQVGRVAFKLPIHRSRHANHTVPSREGRYLDLHAPHIREKLVVKHHLVVNRRVSLSVLPPLPSSTMTFQK